MMEWIVSSTVLIVLMAFLRRIWRGRISLRLQYALWVIVLLRLLIPGNPIESAFSVSNVTQQAAVQNVMESIQEPIRFESEGFSVDEETGEKIPVINTYFLASEQNLNDFFSVKDILNQIWMLGGISLFCFMLTSNLLFLRKVSKNREAVEVDGIPLPVYVTARVETPCLAGVFWPAIYLTPESMAQERMHHVLEHEYTHYCHGDHITAVLRCVALALHWYNPLVWWAASVSKQDAELACDEGTIVRLGEGERFAYGGTLLDMTCVSTKNNVMLTATTMTTGKQSLKERIKLIAKKPKMAAYTLISVILVMAVVVGCTFTGAIQGSGMAQLSDEELIQALLSAENTDSIAQALTAYVEKTELQRGKSRIGVYTDGVGRGYGLSESRQDRLKELFSQYNWERMSDGEPFSEDEDIIELVLEYTDGEKIRLLLQSNSLERELLRVCWYAYDEDGSLMRDQQSGIFKSTPKEVGIPIYNALMGVFEEQEGAMNQSQEETSVQVEVEEESVFLDLPQEILGDCTHADMILMRTVSPTLAFDIGEEQMHSLVELLKKYTWVRDPSWYPPQEGGHPILMCGYGGGAMIFYDTAEYVYMTIYGEAPGDEYSFMWKAVTREEGAKPLYEEVAAIYQGAILDDYYERSSNNITDFLYSEILEMGESATISSYDQPAGKHSVGESELVFCAEMIRSCLWIEALNDTYMNIYQQDEHTILLEGNGRSIKYYSDQNLVKYTHEDTVRYLFYFPIQPADQSIVDSVIAVFNQIAQE